MIARAARLLGARSPLYRWAPRLTPKSIRAQLTLWYLLMLAAALAAFAVFVFTVRARTLAHEADADLEVHAHRVLSTLQPSLLELDVHRALSIDRRLDPEPIAVREVSGDVVFRSEAFPPLGAAAEREASVAARSADRFATVGNESGEDRKSVV